MVARPPPSFLTEAEHVRVADAVAAAEAATSVELRVVLAHWSSHYGAFALIYPALLALGCGGVAAAVLPGLRAATLFQAQAALFAVGVLLLQWPRLRRAVAPGAIKRKAAWRHARLHYASIGLTQPHTRSAALIFCSAAERSVEILVDDAIAEKLPQSTWSPIVESLRAGFAQRAIADALIDAARSCAAILAPSFPPAPGLPNEVPDALVEI